MSRFSALTHRLYTGEISYDFIGRRRRWYLLSAILLTVSLLSLLVRGLDFGIEFEGGADFRAPTQVNSQTVDRHARRRCEETGLPDLDDSTITTIGNDQVRVQTRPLDSTTEVRVVRRAIAEEVGIPIDEVAYSLIGASWGTQITERALIALAVFLALVALVIWAYFRNGKMSAAALIALGHDLILTIGIYALVGFTVTPATLIGILTILGLLAVRHRRGVRQGPGERPRHQVQHDQDLLRGREHGGQPGAGPVDQHHDHRCAAGGGAAVRRRGHPGRGSAEGPGPGVVRRHGLRGVLLDLHRHSDPRPAQGARAGHEEAGRPGGHPPGQGGPEGRGPERAIAASAAIAAGTRRRAPRPRSPAAPSPTGCGVEPDGRPIGRSTASSRRGARAGRGGESPPTPNWRPRPSARAPASRSAG